MARQVVDLENFIFDDLGVRLPPLCKQCSGCHNCTQQRSELSRDDREVYNLVCKGMTLDEENAKITAQYPVNDYYLKLEDNRKQAITRQTSVEKSLKKREQLEPYNANFQDAIDRGVLVEVSLDEIEA